MLRKSFVALGLASLISIASMNAMADGKRMAKRNSHKSNFFKGNNYIKLSVGIDQNHALQRNSQIYNKPNASMLAGLAYEKALGRLRLGVSYNYLNDTNGKDYSRDDSGKQTIASWGYKSNIFLGTISYDLLSQGDVMPFVKLGLGVALNSSSKWKLETPDTVADPVVSGSNRVSNFAWKAGFGFRMNSAKNIETEFEYAYFDKGEIKSKLNSFKGSVLWPKEDGGGQKKGIAKSHSASFSIAYKF